MFHVVRCVHILMIEGTQGSVEAGQAEMLWDGGGGGSSTDCVRRGVTQKAVGLKTTRATPNACPLGRATSVL